jgi:hypothetical protein
VGLVSGPAGPSLCFFSAHTQPALAHSYLTVDMSVRIILAVERARDIATCKCVLQPSCSVLLLVLVRLASRTAPQLCDKIRNPEEGRNNPRPHATTCVRRPLNMRSVIIYLSSVFPSHLPIFGPEDWPVPHPQRRTRNAAHSVVLQTGLGACRGGQQRREDVAVSVSNTSYLVIRRRGSLSHPLRHLVAGMQIAFSARKGEGCEGCEESSSNVGRCKYSKDGGRDGSKDRTKRKERNESKTTRRRRKAGGRQRGKVGGKEQTGTCQHLNSTMRRSLRIPLRIHSGTLSVEETNGSKPIKDPELPDKIQL